MLQKIISLDHELFLVINHLPHNFFLNWFFLFLTFFGYWGIGYLLIALSFSSKKKNFIIFGLSIFLTVICGITSDVLLKNLFQRVRPEFSPLNAIVVFDWASSFSFPSGHALVSFAFAPFFSFLESKKSFFFYLLAFLIGFSRIYLGKHYPSDIFLGAVLGFLIGQVAVRIYKKI